MLKMISELLSCLEIFCGFAVRSWSAAPGKNSCRLPKLEIPKFSGSPTDWPGFWDQFQTSVLSSDGLSDNDRFNYLKKYLCGSTAECVSCLALSIQSFKEAISIFSKKDFVTHIY